ncbi:MAG: hypothetical protein DHS20C09_06000 [marine bacterium B5-7]|nr:MAG: hypothetical protein DHS20C09_06000 [marine bacterium B5-7]
MKDKLNNILFFSYLHHGQMDKLIPYLETLELSAGETLFNEKDTGDCVYFIISGSLEVIKKTNWRNISTIVTALREGSCIGEMALINRYPRTTTLRAYEVTKLTVLTQRAFDVMIGSEPELAVNILKGLAQTLSDNLHPTKDKLVDEVAA